jgi:hypothetical protein
VRAEGREAGEAVSAHGGGSGLTPGRASTEGGAGGVGCLGGLEGLEGAGWRRWLGYEKDEDEFCGGVWWLRTAQDGMRDVS